MLNVSWYAFAVASFMYFVPFMNFAYKSVAYMTSAVDNRSIYSNTLLTEVLIQLQHNWFIFTMGTEQSGNAACMQSKCIASIMFVGAIVHTERVCWSIAN